MQAAGEARTRGVGLAATARRARPLAQPLRAVEHSSSGSSGSSRSDGSDAAASAERGGLPRLARCAAAAVAAVVAAAVVDAGACAQVRSWCALR
jgi:hypothetical protein